MSDDTNDGYPLTVEEQRALHAALRRGVQHRNDEIKHLRARVAELEAAQSYLIEKFSASQDELRASSDALKCAERERDELHKLVRRECQ